MRINYKTALVTGASRGIGAAICRALVGEGLEVYAVARKAEGLAVLQKELGKGLHTIVSDARDHTAITAALHDVELDVVVNNAGAVASVRPLYEQTAEEVEAAISLNFISPIHLMRTFLPGMVSRRRGHIVNITSTAGQGALKGTVVYGATKAGLAHASQVMRLELAGTNVRVTDVAPGRVETDFYLETFGGDRSALKSGMYTRQRALLAEDLATAIVFALGMPARADIAQITVSPTDQALGGHVFSDFEEASTEVQ